MRKRDPPGCDSRTPSIVLPTSATTGGCEYPSSTQETAPSVVFDLPETKLCGRPGYDHPARTAPSVVVYATETRQCRAACYEYPSGTQDSAPSVVVDSREVNHFVPLRYVFLDPTAATPGYEYPSSTQDTAPSIVVDPTETNVCRPQSYDYPSSTQDTAPSVVIDPRKENQFIPPKYAPSSITRGSIPSVVRIYEQEYVHGAQTLEKRSKEFLRVKCKRNTTPMECPAVDRRRRAQTNQSKREQNVLFDIQDKRPVPFIEIQPENGQLKDGLEDKNRSQHDTATKSRRYCLLFGAPLGLLLVAVAISAVVLPKLV